MRVGNPLPAMLGLALAVCSPCAATAQAQTIDMAQAEKLTADPDAARALIEGGRFEYVAWSYFFWVNSPLTGAAPGPGTRGPGPRGSASLRRSRCGS